MGSSMTCKQQYCCGNMRDCSGPYKMALMGLAPVFSKVVDWDHSTVVVYSHGEQVRTVNAGFARS